MASQEEDLNLFSDKRFRETRLRRSVVAIDDTDLLMQMRNDRRRSIISMNKDDGSSGDGRAWNRVWNNITTSPNNLRNNLSSTR